MAESGGVSEILGAGTEPAAEGSIAETPVDPTAAALAAEAAKSDPELAQEASAYFRKQSHLIEVQTEHLHEQRAVNLSLLKLKRFDERLKVGLRARWRTVPSESTMRLPRIWISWRCWRRAASKVPASLCRSFRR